MRRGAPQVSVAARAQLGARWATVALGFSLPISVALNNILIGIILLCWLASGGFRDKLARLRASPVALASLAFLALLLAGMAWGPGAPRDGLNAFGKYADLLLVALLCMLVIGERHQRLGLLAFGAAMGVTLIASYGIWLEVLPVKELGGARGPNNPVVFKLQITHGILMALAAFLAAVAALHARSPRLKALAAGACLLAVFNVLFMVQGRTGYIVLGALALYLFVSLWRWRGVAVAAIAGVLAVGTAHLVDAPMLGRIATAKAELDDWQAGRGYGTSTGLRLNYYRTSLAIIEEHPLIGVGTGGFEIAYRQKVAGTGQAESNNPHNQYLLTTAQLGVPGLAALLAMFAAMWWQARRLAAPHRLAARGLVLTIAVGSLLNSFLIDHTEGLLFAWMAGLLFAAPTQPHRAAP
jgi:O-antigen ligase